MGLDTRVFKLLKQVGIWAGQIVLDFGCGYGTYTIPVAEIVDGWGKVYALDKDKEVLDKLMQNAGLMGLRNIEKIETSGELETGLANCSIDVALLFDVFHEFYFPGEEDRKKLLDEMYRIMRPSGILSVSVWSNLIEAEIADEIKNAKFYLEKEVPEMLTGDHKVFGIHTFWNYRKA